MGLSSSSDEWCRHSDKAIEGLAWARKIVDDILIWAPSLEELAERIRIVARKCATLGIVLSKKKMTIGEEISFAGMVINAQGIKPDPERIKALQEFPVPKDTTGVRAFLGLANQLSGFVPDFAHMTVRLRGLTGKGASFIWLQDHQEEFNQIRQLLCSSMVVMHFNPNLPVIILTDASRLYGLGYAMGHIVDGQFKIVTCGSKALTPTQQRYATVELECLAVVYAITKCGFYVKGLPHFSILTDHRPLEGVFKKDLFELTNPRLQRMREKLAEYTFSVTWVPGKTHYVADALSRAPLFSAEEEDLTVDTARACLVHTDGNHLERILDCIDADYRALRKDVKETSCKSVYMQQLKSTRNNLSVDEDLVYLDASRIVLPMKAVKPVLHDLHRSHSGVVKTYELAKSLYYWPGMWNDIRQVISQCTVCAKFGSSQQDNPRTTPPPSTYMGAPMKQIGLDLFDFGGKQYLACVDQWSGYLLVHRLSTLTASAIVKILSTWFNAFGWPQSIRSDGGPQFLGDFKRFCRDNEISHEQSAPYNPKSNGLAESGVKAAKKLLSKAKETNSDFERLLYEYRNVPRAHGFSSAQLMFGRAQRMNLPQSKQSFLPISFNEAAAAKDKLFKEAGPAHDKGKKMLEQLQVGEHVLIQDSKTKQWDKSGCINEIRPDGLSYLIDQDGKQVLRSRKMLKRKVSGEFFNNQGGAVSNSVNSYSSIATPVHPSLVPSWEVQTPSRWKIRSTSSLQLPQISTNSSDSSLSALRNPIGTKPYPNLPAEIPSSQYSLPALPLVSPSVPSSSSSRPSALGSTAARGEPRGRPGPATLAIANCYNPSNHWQTQPSLLPSPLPPPHQVLPTHHQTQGSPALLQPPYQAVTGSGLQWGGAPRPWHPFLPTCAPRPTRMPIQHKADPQEATPFQTSPSLQHVACQDAAPQVAMSHPPPLCHLPSSDPFLRISGAPEFRSSTRPLTVVRESHDPARGSSTRKMKSSWSSVHGSIPPQDSRLPKPGPGEPPPLKLGIKKVPSKGKNQDMAKIRPAHSVKDYNLSANFCNSPGSIWNMKLTF
jgi:hypothetical protein